MHEPLRSEKSNATTARGMLIQLSQPKNGIIPRNMMNRERKQRKNPGIARIVRIV